MPILASGKMCPSCGKPKAYLEEVMSSTGITTCYNITCLDCGVLYTRTIKKDVLYIWNNQLQSPLRSVPAPQPGTGNMKPNKKAMKQFAGNLIPFGGVGRNFFGAKKNSSTPIYQIVDGPKDCPDCNKKGLVIRIDSTLILHMTTPFEIYCEECKHTFFMSNDLKELKKSWDYWTRGYKNPPAEKRGLSNKETLETNRNEQRDKCVRCGQKTFRKDVLMFVVEHYCSCCDDKKKEKKEDRVPF